MLTKEREAELRQACEYVLNGYFGTGDPLQEVFAVAEIPEDTDGLDVDEILAGIDDLDFVIAHWRDNYRKTWKRLARRRALRAARRRLIGR